MHVHRHSKFLIVGKIHILLLQKSFMIFYMPTSCVMFTFYFRLQVNVHNLLIFNLCFMLKKENLELVMIHYSIHTNSNKTLKLTKYIFSIYMA